MKCARGSIVVALAAFAACAEAGGDTTGGGLTPAGQLAATPPVFVAPVREGGADEAAAPGECGSGTKWSELYRDIFGPTNKPGSCVLFSQCHGSPEGEGAQANAGIRCFDEAGCRQSMIDQGLVRAGNPTLSGLFSVIRMRDASGAVIGFMPQEPSDYVFPPACLERMRGWIRNGAPAD